MDQYGNQMLPVKVVKVRAKMTFMRIHVDLRGRGWKQYAFTRTASAVKVGEVQPLPRLAEKQKCNASLERADTNEVKHHRRANLASSAMTPSSPMLLHHAVASVYRTVAFLHPPGQSWATWREVHTLASGCPSPYPRSSAGSEPCRTQSRRPIGAVG
jgi:hypothetical protein